MDWPCSLRFLVGYRIGGTREKMSNGVEVSAFSDSYIQARGRFLYMVEARGAQLVSEVHPFERGVHGEDLAIDVAIFGDPAATKTLFLISGTHGQEGFLGSALQIAFLENLEIPDGLNVVVLHALNPWGFSHGSRTDEENIDVNRNFGDATEEFEEDELCPILFQAMCPDDWIDETIDWSIAREKIIQQYGLQRMITALAGGQTSEPTGLNFVGLRPSWSRRVVAKILPRVFRHARKIAFLEWHTGLGKFGELSHLCSFEPESPSYERIFSWMGDAARTSFAASFDVTDGQVPSYQGLFSKWLPATAPQAEWTGLLIEVGTYDNLTVGDAVRIDRWLRFGEGVTTFSREKLHESMMNSLYPKSPKWRKQALRNGLEAQSQVLYGLQEW